MTSTQQKKNHSTLQEKDNRATLQEKNQITSQPEKTQISSSQQPEKNQITSQPENIQIPSDNKNWNPFEHRLEWRQRMLEDGTAFFRHPSFEEVLAVKQARFTVEREVEKAARRTERSDQRASVAAKRDGKHHVSTLTLDVVDKNATETSERVKRAIVSHGGTLAPVQVAAVRELRNADPHTHTSQSLAKQFAVKRELVQLVSKEREDKALEEINRIKKWNRNKPKKGSKYKRVTYQIKGMH